LCIASLATDTAAYIEIRTRKKLLMVGFSGWVAFPYLMQDFATLSGTTISCVRPVEAQVRIARTEGDRVAVHAGSWMRISQNLPSTHSGE
jgi:hypothetical protein